MKLERKIILREPKSLLQRIDEDLGSEIKNKIDLISNEASIYVLSIASVRKVTQKDLEIGFASYHARYPERTIESYIKFKSNWDEDKFSYNVEPQGYFIDENVAVDYANKNKMHTFRYASYKSVVNLDVAVSHKILSSINSCYTCAEYEVAV